MNEYSHEQILAVEAFAKGLKDCYESRLKDTKPGFTEGVEKLLLDYCLKVLTIHLELARIKFERFANNMAERTEK